MEEVETEGMLTQDFYYTALILARYSDMPPEERQSVIDFINEYRYSEFAWRGGSSQYHSPSRRRWE
ncbi:hypothetical protein [Thermococcus sp. JCM 11816]|uniref:hypothetical protein n=1 Tax=Thermococcus sp. (strain JCM 11816 / KS-1) TaxID=1295125 RepID=UPI000AC8FB8C